MDSGVVKKFRVTVYMDGKPQFYNDYDHEVVADEYADKMRNLYKGTGLSVFVKKKRLP